MFIKCKNGIKAEMVYQGKACTVGKAQPFVLKPSEYCLCSSFKFLSNPLDFYMSFVYLVHEFNSRCVAASHFQESVGFIQDIIRCVDEGISLLKFCMNGFSLWIIQVFRDGEGTEGAGINKNLQSRTSPYRYLS